MIQKISIQDARNDLSNLVSQAAIAGRQFVITKFGKPSAMLVPVNQNAIKKKSNLKAAFGIWKDRKDITDSAKWVTKMRARWSTRND